MPGRHVVGIEQRLVLRPAPEERDFVAGIERVVDELGIPRPLPPLSAIGVDYLFEPDVLVEVETYTVLD